MLRYAIALTAFLGLILMAASGAALAQCQAEPLEQFLEERAFELSADEKINLYAAQLVRYYGKRDVTRQQVLRSMKAWERRWPERIYKFISIIEFRRTEAGDACKVKFAYRFLAYSPERDKVSAGIGTSTLVLADVGDGGRFKIIGEIGEVKCRGLEKFARSRC
mgnify:CR=1 FL=1